jgi:hypothetical protein
MPNLIPNTTNTKRVSIIWAYSSFEPFKFSLEQIFYLRFYSAPKLCCMQVPRMDCQDVPAQECKQVTTI